MNAVGADIKIVGAGAGTTIIDGNSIDRVLKIDGGRKVDIEGVSIIHGYTSSIGGYGAGIYNSGVLGLSNTILEGNKANGSGGGGLYSDGVAMVNNSSFTGNTGPVGGGIHNRGTLDLFQCTVADNQGNGGGGIFNNYVTGTTNALHVNNSTIQGQQRAERRRNTEQLEPCT